MTNVEWYDYQDGFDPAVKVCIQCPYPYSMCEGCPLRIGKDGCAAGVLSKEESEAVRFVLNRFATRQDIQDTLNHPIPRVARLARTVFDENCWFIYTR